MAYDVAPRHKPDFHGPYVSAAKTSKEAVVEEGDARGRKRKAGGDTRRRRSERGERRGRQGTTERAERDDAERDEGERT